MDCAACGGYGDQGELCSRCIASMPATTRRRWRDGRASLKRVVAAVRQAVRAGILLAVLLSAYSADAAQVNVCMARVCTPPTIVFRDDSSPPPFDAPVRFGGEKIKNGMRSWLWIKAGEPSRPCTAKELVTPTYDLACRVKVGEPLYQSQPVRVTE